MKTHILTATALASLLVLGGCGSNPLKPGGGMEPGASATTPISEQVAVNDFTRLGVKVKYKLLSGDLESIEATGYAPVWGNSASAVRESFRVAELEAKKSLNDFINRENITTSTSVKMISKNLEQAHDNKKNNFMSNIVKASDEFTEMDADIRSTPESVNGTKTNNNNTAVRNDALKIATTVNNNINIKSSGILGGLYMVEGKVIKGGKNVMVIYRWDAKSIGARPTIRAAMMQ
jgi:hypothetical protein|tara:strand:+ start:4677 stop:5378 length:702 start_codon:yes stop_codon:yes gene_type:complete